MFENFERAKKVKTPKWAGPLIGAVAVFHALLLIAMWAKSVWAIDLLELPKGTIEIAAAAPPPPPPPPPPGGKKPEVKKDIPKKKKITETVQPVKIEKNEPPPEVQEDTGDEAGEEGGVEGGVAGGVAGGSLDGVLSAAPPPPPPPPPAQPQIVPPNAVEANRISGEKMIVPDDVTKTEISRSGKNKLVGAFKLCLTAAGSVQRVDMSKSTGFPAYDNRILAQMRVWKYRPFTVNGTPTPVCTSVTFIYNQK
jgi:protein TonB